MIDFVQIEGTDGCQRAFPATSVRLLTGNTPDDGMQNPITTVMLIDGTWFYAKGCVADIVKAMEVQETW